MGGNKMKKDEKILTLLKDRKWEQLAELFTPAEIADNLAFNDALRVAYNLLYNERWDSENQDYAVILFNIIRDIFPEEWNQSWEYDALLGLAYEITYQYDQRYEAYKRAFDKASSPPPRLLIELARCSHCPGRPPIDYDEAIDLIKKALIEATYSDGVGLLSHIYSLKGDKVNEAYWKEVLKNTDHNFNSPSIEPKFLVDDYLKGKGIVKKK